MNSAFKRRNLTMNKYRNRSILALLIAAVMTMSVCLAGCDLFGIEDDGGDINVTEKLNLPDKNDSNNKDEGTGLENPDDPDDPTIKNYDNGVKYPEEVPGSELKLKQAEASDFFGSWEAKSGDAHYLLGSLVINIKNGGFWTGTLDEESLRGTWKEKNGGIYIESNDLSGQLNFSKDNKLILRFKLMEESEDYTNIVLTKV